MTTGGMQHEMRMVQSKQLCLLVVASANKLCQWEMQHELWKVLCLLVGEGTIEQLVDSVVDGGGKYSGELCKLVCSCQLMAVVVTQWQWEMQHEMRMPVV